ncbi:hypothetical protein LWI29_000348 [Acer saccharum]|uniref:Uncharacterized protein n=1 Tax=Acer saccharum TaxID=4024 RepID=A0AA39VJG8_ACESA|nr:hypothetical protein LWI29_000348 [Acer saccharum]
MNCVSGIFGKSSDEIMPELSRGEKSMVINADAKDESVIHHINNSRIQGSLDAQGSISDPIVMPVHNKESAKWEVNGREGTAINNEELRNEIGGQERVGNCDLSDGLSCHQTVLEAQKYFNKRKTDIPGSDNFIRPIVKGSVVSGGPSLKVIRQIRKNIGDKRSHSGRLMNMGSFKGKLKMSGEKRKLAMVNLALQAAIIVLILLLPTAAEAQEFGGVALNCFFRCISCKIKIMMCCSGGAAAFLLP